MLKKLSIQGFKSLHDVELEFPKLLLLFGPNAAGKSNLIDALTLLSRLASERTVADAMSPPARGLPTEAFTLPHEGLKGLLSQSGAELTFAADLSPDEGYPRNQRRQDLRYEVTVRIEPRTGELSVTREFLCRMDREGRLLDNPKPRIETSGNVIEIRRHSVRGTPPQEHVGQNHTKLSDTRYSGENYADLQYVRQELSGWRTYYLDPRVAMRSAQPPREVEDIGPDGEWIAPFLHRLKNHSEFKSRFKAIVRVLKSVIPSVDQVDVDLDKKRGVLDIEVTQNGTPYSSRIVSEGTLRVLALAAIAANPWPTPLIAFEEPENGVHPRRLEKIGELLHAIALKGDTQLVVTTHSPRLAAILAAKSSEDRAIGLRICRGSGAGTELNEFPDIGPLWNDEEIRRALSEPGDERFFEAALLRGWLDG